MNFKIIGSRDWIPDKAKNITYLKKSLWNDYLYVTMFTAVIFDEQGTCYELGDIKIGFKGQTTETSTFERLEKLFNELPDIFFSLGSGSGYYKQLYKVPEIIRNDYLISMRDIVQNQSIINNIKDEDVFKTSLLRDPTLSLIKGQFSRVLKGANELTPFNFRFVRPSFEKFGGIDLSFEVEVDSRPPTNIHAIIGRNGVGKTTLLNGMIDAITSKNNNQSKFYDVWHQELSKDFFSSLLSISFSAFDPFIPPKEQPDPAKGTCYFYMGFKNEANPEQLRSLSELYEDCITSLINCFNEQNKKNLWRKAITKLGSDENFQSMQLETLDKIYAELKDSLYTYFGPDSRESYDSYLKELRFQFRGKVFSFLQGMSSGHAVVFMTITRLVEKVDEKTLILMDEPESHLHPPLLSAFIRALSDLLLDRNAVAIIATHSPVVLQETPRSCVWKIFRRGADVQWDRPNIETFAENVGDLTSEVFGLELETSGFHDLIQKSVDEKKSYNEIVEDFGNQIGFEGRALLKVMIAERDKDQAKDV